MPNLSVYRRAEWLALAGIIVLAAVLRLGMPGVVEFKRDEANLSALAYDMAHLKTFPLLGIDSSVGIPNAPVSVYLTAVPYIFSSDPTTATLYVGLLNVIAVGLTFALVRRYYGPWAATCAGVFYAVAPWGVIFSRKIWAQDMLPLFVVLTIGTGLLGFLEGKRWAQWLHLPLLAFTGQIHYGAFVLIPASLFVIVAGRKHWTRAFFLSFLVTGLVVAPYAIGAIQSSLLKPGVLQKIGSTGDKPHTLTVSNEALVETGIIISGADIHSLAGDKAYADFLATVPNVYGFFDLLGILIFLGAFWLLIRTLWRRDSRSIVDVTLLLWFCFPPLAYTITWTPMYIHYLIPLIPAAFIILGVAMSDLWALLPLPKPIDPPVSLEENIESAPIAEPNVWEMLRARLTIFGGAGLGMIAVFQVWLVVALLIFLDSHSTAGAFGIPLGHLMTVRTAVLAAHPDSVLADLDGQYIGYNDQTTIWNFLLIDVPQVRFLDHGIDVFPSQPPLYLTLHCDAHPTLQRFDLPNSDGCLALGIRPAKEQPAILPIGGAGKFANGMQFEGFIWQNACLTLDSTPDHIGTDDFQVAVHILNADGQKIADADAIGWRGRYWRPGDHILRTFCLPDPSLAPQAARAQIGMYTYLDQPDGRHFTNIDLLDAAGTPIGQLLDVHLK
jgi:hypothetical protein